MSPAPSDFLEPLSIAQLKCILSKLESHLPTAVRDYSYLFHYLKNLDVLQDPARSANISVACKPRFFGPSSGCSSDHCTYIAISEANPDENYLFLSTQENDASELVKCLSNTKLIDWNVSPLDISCDEKHMDEVLKVLKSKANKWIVLMPERVYFCPKNTAKLFAESKIPQSYKLKDLASENARLIDDNWAYKYSGSLKLIESSIELNGGLGLFDDCDKMIAWIATNELCSPGFLFVTENERKKGFGALLLKQEFKRLAKNLNIDVCCRVVKDNEASTKLMENIGFTHVSTEIWIQRVKKYYNK